LTEEKQLASKIKHELDATIKSFVSRSNDKYGKALQKYFNDIKKISYRHLEIIFVVNQFLEIM